MPEQVTRSIIVKGSMDKIYSIWADFQNFPHFMQYIRSIALTGNDTSHWEMSGPLGKTIEWNARITANDVNKRIAWSSTDGDIKTSGQVTFNNLPHDETEVTVTMQYIPPAGKAGEMVADVFSNPEKMLEQDLANFKAYAEGMHDRIRQ